MQQAYKPAQELNPTQSLLVTPGHTCVIFSPEALDLSRKFVGLQKIEARHLVLMRDQVYIEKDSSETIFTADPGVERGLVRQVKTALACALEINIQHGARGMVILDCMIDAHEAQMAAFEAKLEALGWFTNPRLDALESILAKVVPSSTMEEKAIEALRTAISTAVTYRVARADDMLGEAQRAREGKQGRASMTRTEREYLMEIGMDLPESLTAPMPAALDEQTLNERFEKNNQALIETLSAAMNNFAAAVLARTEGSNEKANTEGKASEGKEEGAASAGTTESSAPRTRRSPLATA